MRGAAWCLVVCLGACGFLRACRERNLGVATGPCLRGFLLRVVPHTLVAPLRRSGGVRAGVVTWVVLVVWVGVLALRLWAEWLGHDAGTTAGLDTSSVAAASHTLAAVASNAIITLQQTHPLRRHHALQHGRPT